MIGDRLLELRKDKGITQETLGFELSVSKHTISNYELEYSEPNDEMKIRIARYFNVSIDYLLGLSNEPTPIQDDVTVVRLPMKLPQSARFELKEYIDFLEHKYSD